MSHFSAPPQAPRGHRRPARGRRLLLAVASVAALALIAWPVMSHFDIPPFTDKGEPVSFGPGGTDPGADSGTGTRAAGAKALMPTGPAAAFKNAETLDNGTHVAVVDVDGKKSGFKGKVWVWAPKEYSDPKYAKSGFPVMIALPGGPGFPTNYWMSDSGLHLESSIEKWVQEGKSKPFLLAMPVLNPHTDEGGLYWDGSDIPGQPKMGTWLTEDVPDLMKQNFRTLKSRDGWSFMGSSSGGFAGLKAVLKHPDKFKTVIASGPDIVPDSPLWHGDRQAMAANNPEELSKKLIAAKGPDVYLAFQYGTNEKNEKKKVDKYLATYGNKGPVHTHLQVIQGGDHNAKSYLRGMDESSIKWISDHMAGPEA
ncbi:alpha/beta hydrolase [Streptomyces monticola]|uniref:Alpha/beta hydrolase n=1 Tax=Streptomyces monticola TaxID=2666263 RepID=A0ABW2JE06_9ACTN